MSNVGSNDVPLYIQRGFYKHAPPPKSRITPLELAQLLSVKCNGERVLDAHTAFDTVAAALPKLQLMDGTPVTSLFQVQTFFRKFSKFIDPKEKNA